MVVYVGACILVDGLITAAGMWNIETSQLSRARGE